MALTIKEIETAKPKDKKYKMLDGGGPQSAGLADSHEALALALSVQWQREEHDIWGVPGCCSKEARDLHFAAKRLLATGINPMAERKEEAEAK